MIRRNLTHLLILAVMGLGTTLWAQGGAGSKGASSDSNSDVQADRKDLRQDRRDLGSDRKDIRADKRDLNKDRADRKGAWKSGGIQ